MEESEKVQHWVERLCQTRLEQISCVENESSEVKTEVRPGPSECAQNCKKSLHESSKEEKPQNQQDLAAGAFRDCVENGALRFPRSP